MGAVTAPAGHSGSGGLDLGLRVAPRSPGQSGISGANEIRIAAPPIAVRPKRSRIRPTGQGTYEYRHDEFRAKIDHDGTIEFEDRLNPFRDPAPRITFDLTDAIIRTFTDDDPYRALKEEALRETAGLRGELAARACRERLDRSVLDLTAHLEAIWADPSMDVPTKRAQVFQLWDECTEEGDEAVMRASRLARATIYAFIRDVIGQRDCGYNPAELTALNERRASVAPFAPYARTSTRPAR